MSLSPGTRLGAFEIGPPLGIGGMGEVYRARDTRLGRDVAIKVLGESFVHDADRIARFQREAQLLAALNHPHIATIYGLEESGGTQFLAMELVDGETLAERLQRGPMPVPEALEVARQVADALQAAHERGIIHRDLKPANIALTAAGEVKVLDFGLAKAVGPAEAGPHDAPGITQSPTLTLAATGVGVILGTAAYMAPEQAKGKPADKRSDVWAFGCVLYEMLTGKRPFEGEAVSETLAFVLTKAPDLDALPKTLPPVLRALVARCLEKDRRRRVADLSAALFALDEAGTIVERADGAPIGAELAALRRARLHQWGWSAAVLIAGAAVAAGATWLAARPAPVSVVRMEIVTAGRTALRIQGADRDVAITPDGSRIVYRGSNQLLVRSLDQLEPVRLTGLGTPRGLFVSPDGEWIGFTDGTNLRKVPTAGGPATNIAVIDGAAPRGATWGDGGTIVFATASTATGLHRVSSNGGEIMVLTKPDGARGEADHHWPEFLPENRGVLFTITPTIGGVDSSQIAVLDLRTGATKVVVRGGAHAHYVPSGHLVYGSGGALRAIAFDLDRLESTGSAVPVMEGVATGLGFLNMALARNGTMVYVSDGPSAAGHTLTWVDRTGREEPIPVPLRPYRYARISPDGTRVALDIRDQEYDVWILDLARVVLTRLTFDPALDGAPLWTRDGSGIVYASTREGPSNLFWQRADGMGAAARLTTSPNGQFPLAVAPDGGKVLFREVTSATAQDIMLLDGDRATPLIQTNFAESNADVSPDGRWVVYQSQESGRDEVYVRPFPNVDDGRWQISAGGGREPVWSRDGRELFYVSPDDALMMVQVAGSGAWQSATPTPLLKQPYLYNPGNYGQSFGGTNGRVFDITPDGKRFLMVKQAPGTSSLAGLVVVQNWFEELTRLVPAD